MPNLRKYKGLLNDTIAQSFAQNEKLLKVEIMLNSAENSQIAKMEKNKSIETFKSMKGTIRQISQINPSFLKKWSKGEIRNSLRFLFLPFEKFSEENLYVLKDFSNLVYIPLRCFKFENSSKTQFLSLFPFISQNLNKKSKINRRFFNLIRDYSNFHKYLEETCPVRSGLYASKKNNFLYIYLFYFLFFIYLFILF